MIDNTYNRFKRYTKKKDQDVRWAEPEEIKNETTRIDLTADTCPTSGLPIICDTKTTWVDGSDNHTLIFGSTGSKKTRLFVMPTIGTIIKSGESFIASDPKGELYEKTAPLAYANGYDVKVLNFREIGKGECWNPLNYPYHLIKNGDTNKACSLISDFINTIVERQANSTADPFWIDSARALGLGLALLLLEAAAEEEANVFTLAKMCKIENENTLNEFLKRMDTSSACFANLSGVLSSADRTLRSIMVVLFSNLSFFLMQKDLSAMLSKNTFNVKDFGDRKTAFYLIVPDEKTTTHFLVSAFIKQAYELLIEKAQESGDDGKLNIRVNFVLDEFCNIPKIPDMPNMISAARSRNIRYFLIAQSLHQLQSRYGADDSHTIKGNCLNWVFLSSKEIELLEEICALCGKNTSDRVPLISTTELQRLSKTRGEALILHDRCHPFLTTLPDFDDYKVFKGFPKREVESRGIPELKSFELTDLLADCLSGNRPFPFYTNDDKSAGFRKISDRDKKLIDALTLAALNGTIETDTSLEERLYMYGYTRNISDFDF